MLGAGTWFIGFGIPAVLAGGFVASRKRLAYQWREELMDPDGGAYPPLTDADMEFIRHVTPPEWPLPEGQLPTAKKVTGLFVSPDVLSGDEGGALLDEVKRWIALYGQKVDLRKVAFAESQAQSEGVDIGFYSDIAIISDHAEDIQLMKAPWETGDRIKHHKMPSSLRYMVNKMQRKFEGLGRLRHVYVEYSPSGRFYHEPKPTKAFDGHDYVVIPLRRDQNATVVTFAPLLRSRCSFVKEVLMRSWTSHDVDVIIPPGSALRVYGSARYEWGWGIRPGNVWFGNYRNSIRHIDAIRTPFYLHNILSSMACRILRPAPSVKESDAALVVLHFDGPRDFDKPRSLLLQPESLIFGRPPTVETYEKWVEEKPTTESVRNEGVFLFMVKNYVEMLRVT
ncbi:uncharacterized protein TEOVI_000005600 [Trypanosoma equiperdum]|uniref:Uncharacterized protein n=4 Tax=Trypanozoon TaxID=39700 RepID=Q38DE3_TRYB2|nr:hypothetical protein, conserved [Trypanosoma brucei gambiense DAL972]XP_827507.1 hypothetical protein, conserved [Trypanosoma brucei brucei TREU927]RHW70635.1 hypothetical protein DPX39_090075500 [Trypanosoma brucei equiperdum]SCU64324.1 hypothetical protein, conserved [Trypanosoma equiperdum]EAN77177.1 hypothetical protein, conserved [Trypanosoma brucei brucei TREU927]CBH14701.1 hypothetical protein, conserved [Trypanosoma brucei gambiense DAL972]|eukprot:XP_011776967.1 hypothetical protein, conserved [Trypanosoma brucei gambiense DAL972]